MLFPLFFDILFHAAKRCELRGRRKHVRHWLPVTMSCPPFRRQWGNQARANPADPHQQSHAFGSCQRRVFFLIFWCYVFLSSFFFVSRFFVWEGREVLNVDSASGKFQTSLQQTYRGSGWERAPACVKPYMKITTAIRV